MNVIEPTGSPRPSDAALNEAHELVRQVSQWPFVRVDLHGDDVALHWGPFDTFVARLNLLTGVLTTYAIADMARSLASTEPLLRVTRDAVRLEVVDADS